MAVRGIAEHGLPILPSGLLYDRGILYSYVSWIAHAVTGSELPAYRAISFVCAIVALWLVIRLVTRIHNRATGFLAAALVGTAIPFWATATSARFYAPFFALYLATLVSLQRSVGHPAVGHPALAGLLRLIFLFAFLARLTHELAFTLAIIPAVCWLIDRDNRERWLRSTIAVVAGLVLGQLFLLALHWLSPTSGDTMVRRFFLWQVLNLFERPGDRQFGIPIVVMVISLIVAPKRAWPLVTALCLATMILAFSIAQATNRAPLSVALLSSVLVEGSRYPLDMFWHIARQTPVLLCFVLGAMLYRAARTEWPLRHRAAHALWIGWVLWFGVIESGITTNYLLLPVTFMLIALAIDLVAIAGDEGDEESTWRDVIALTIVAAMLTGAQFRNSAFETARPTIRAEGIDEIRDSLQPNDRVVCTDELGCMMLVGRIDRWLALDNYVRERFLVKRGDGPVTGVYTGVPAIFRPADVFAPNPDGSVPNRIVIVDIFKDYPIGNSRFWLPKAIDEDGVPVSPLLETPQLRVLEVSLPERVARLR